MKCTFSHFIFFFCVNQFWILHEFMFMYGVSSLVDKTTSSVELYWLSELLCPMITSLSAWKFHYDINDSKMEVAIIFWNFHSQLGFVVKEVEDVREKGESLRCACAERLCRKGAKMSKVFFRKSFCMAKTCYLCEEKKDNHWSDVCIAYKQIFQSGKALPNPEMFWQV